MTSERVGLVLAGGGARGAYEAGVLSVLLPELDREGRAPHVIVGTSVGGINAAFLAANLHRGAEEAGRLMARRWEQVALRDVLRPLIPRQGPKVTLAYLADLLGVPGATLRSLLDPAPLRPTLERWIDWPTLHRNVGSGLVGAVGVVATAAASERSVMFVEGPSQGDVLHSYGARYVCTPLRVEHVLASAAIPALFPAVPVKQPAESRGWYFDGGTRLNTPIKPAIDLGVDRVVIVATHSVEHEAGPERGDHHPDFADGALELVQATLVDPLIEDVRMLGKVNLLSEDCRAERFAEYRRRRGKAAYRTLPYLFTSPVERRALGKVALATLRERYSGLRRLRSPDLSLIGRLVGGRSEQQGELLSYLFFEPDFTRRLVEMGRRDARRLVDGRDGLPWRLEPLGGVPEQAV